MSSGFGESTKSPSPPNSSCCSENSSNKDAVDFECYICFDSAEDPVVTLCGHLFCWPCLYRWLRYQSSRSKGCPVCKALVEEDKLVPLFGKGKSLTDQRIISNFGMEIPPRPSGKRPQTVEENEEEEELEELEEDEEELEELEEDEEELEENEEEEENPDHVTLSDIHAVLVRMEQRFKEFHESTEQRFQRLEQLFAAQAQCFAGLLAELRADADQRIHEGRADA